MGGQKRFAGFIIFFFLVSVGLISQPRLVFSTNYRNITPYHWFDSIYSRAMAFYENGKYRESLNAFQTASRLAQNGDEWNKYIECRFYTGLSYWNLGKIEDSHQEYLKLISITEKRSYSKKQVKIKEALEIICLYKLGMKLRESKEFEKSLSVFQEALDTADKVSRIELKQRILRQISITYWDINDLNNFHDFNELSLTIAKKMKNKEEIGRCLNNLGVFYRKSFQYSKALSIYHQALEIFRDLNDIKEESNIYHNISLIYKDFGDYNKAMNYIKKALDIDKKTQSFEYFPVDFMNIGIIYKLKAEKENNPELIYKAIDYFNHSYSLADKQGNETIKIRSLNNIGNSYMEINEYSNALPYLQKSIKKAEMIQDHESMSMVLNNIGYVYLKTEKHKKAEKYFGQAVQVAQKSSSFHTLWEAYFGLGRIKEKEGNHSKALEYYLKSIKAIEAVKDKIVLDFHSAGFIQERLKVYESLMDLLFFLYEKDARNGYGEDLFRVAERAKAQALLENLINLECNDTQENSSDMEKTSQKYSKIPALSLGEALGFKSSDKYNEGLNQFYQDEEEFINLLNLKYMEMDNNKGGKKEYYVLKKIQNYLKSSKAVLFEYFLGDKRSYLFRVTHKDLKIFMLPSKKSIAKSIYGYLKLLKSPPKGRFKGKTASRRIYRELMAPLDQLDPCSFENIVIVPSGILYYLPFETLIGPRKENNKGREYLISKYKISYMPSSASLVYLSLNREEGVYKKDFLALGNPIIKHKSKKGSSSSNILIQLYQNQNFRFSPLSNSKREIKSISRFFKEGRKDIFLREEASEEIIKKIPLSDYKIIHFSCHGFLDENYPFRSSLVLSLRDGKREDGFLQVKEIYNLKMRSQLVVLSACQTGRGIIKRGEGVLGLPRVFFYSGAESILSSLWRVRDKHTAKFMNLFYEYLASGKSKAYSLQCAKIKFIQSKRHSNPFYWAPFVLNGEFLRNIDF